VNYVLLGQDSGGLRFGNWNQTRPPKIAEQIESLIAKKVPVHVVQEHLAMRGLAEAPRLADVKLVTKANLGKLFETCDQVWHW
jgi:hypothetical protein